MKLLKLTAVLFIIILFFSCKKTQESQGSQNALIVIDSLSVFDIENVYVSVTVKNVDLSNIIEKGICWSKNKTPTVLDSCRKISLSQPFSLFINKAEQKSTLHFRAYIKIGSNIIYSPDKIIKIGSLEIAWEKEFNNGKNRKFVRAILTKDNNLIGLVKTFGNSIAWPEIIKFDSSGNIKWDFEYNKNEWKEPNYIMEVQNGYIFVTSSWEYGENGVYVTKIDLNGTKIWEKSLNRKRNQEFIKISSLANDTLLVTTKAFNGFDNRGIRKNCTINNFKIGLNGILLYEDSISNNNKFNEGSYGFKSLNIPNDGFLVTNYYCPLNSFIITYDILLQKFDNSNSLSWEKTYGGSHNELPVANALASNGNYIILGYTSSFGIASQSSWLFEIDKNDGSKLWENVYSNLKYGKSSYTYPLDLYTIKTGQYYLCGNVSDYSGSTSSAYFTKMSNVGNLLLEYTFTNPSGINYSRADNIIGSSNNEIFIFGSRISELSNNSNILYLTKFKEY